MMQGGGFGGFGPGGGGRGGFGAPPPMIPRAVREEQQRRVRMSTYLGLVQLVSELEAAELEDEAVAARTLVDILVTNLGQSLLPPRDRDR